jgi:hypothetical protein
MNFSDAEQVLPHAGSGLVLATHDGAALRPDGAVTLPALSGALLEGASTETHARPSAGVAL